MKLLLLTCLFFSSCSSYVKSIHKKIDSEKRGKQNKAMRYNGNDRRPIQNPRTLGAASANTRANLPPTTQRQYQSQGSRRYNANDLKDNGDDGSLWSGDNSESFLFVKNNMRKKGDIVILDVYSQLKNQIQDELARNFPDKPKKKKKAKEGEEATPEAEKPTKSASDNPDKVYDKISTSVVEQVNQDYLLIRGRKEIMYKKFKRFFEIQALVSQKDIGSNDTVPSKKVLEPKIKVLRY